MHSPALKQKITELYESDSQTAHRFRYTLLALDVVTILFLIGSTFFYGFQAQPKPGLGSDIEIRI